MASWRTIVLMLLSVFVVTVVVETVAPSMASAQEEGEAKKPEAAGKNRLWWVIETSGWIGLFILGLSVWFISIVIRLFMEFQEKIACPPEEYAHVEELVGQKNFQGLYDFAKGSESYFARLVATGIAELPAGLAEAREAMDRMADAEGVDMDRKTSMLAVMGTLGPMIGLVGTLSGMIKSFATIALSSGDTPIKPAEVAGGISEALLLTFEGVFLSIPAIFFFALFRNRAAHMGVNTLLKADEVMRKIWAFARPRAGGAPARPVGV